MKALIVIFSIFIFSFSGVAGNNDKAGAAVKNISGKVIDNAGREIPAAQIIIKETNEIFYADVNGNFNFRVKADKGYSISINSIGYAPVEICSSRLGNFSEISLPEL